MTTMGLILRMALFVLVGAPLVWVVWEAVNSILSGHPGDVRWTWTLPALALLIVLLLVLARAASRIDAVADEPGDSQ